MRITQESDYALRVLLFLFQREETEKIEAKVISEALKIPLRFLLKLLRKLTVAGILKSYRGVGGGYIIAKAPAEITFYDVITAIDGPVYINRCLYDKAHCSLNCSDRCQVHGALAKIQRDLIHNLKNVNFENLTAIK